jgi:hypothetical protein
VTKQAAHDRKQKPGLTSNEIQNQNDEQDKSNASATARATVVPAATGAEKQHKNQDQKD